MALGYMMFSMPTALFGSCLLCVQNGFGPTHGLALYSVIGTALLVAAALYYGAEQR